MQDKSAVKEKQEEKGLLQDGFGRRLSYLRISVTERCNLRCLYCMPEAGIRKRPHREILSYEEIYKIASVAVSLGIRKIRLTGGEALVRRGLPDLLRMLNTLRAEGLEELCLTTNGTLLAPQAEALKKAGLDRINFSLDSLRPERYRKITRGGDIRDFKAGFAAAEAAGFEKSKINTVLLKGFKDDEIEDLAALSLDKALDMRFIELMPIGEGAAYSSKELSGSVVLERLPELEPLAQEGVSRYYRLPGAKGRIGLISAMSRHFCPGCNRLRLTADGRLKNCLHGAAEYPVAGKNEEAIRRTFIKAAKEKPFSHHLNEEQSSRSRRYMHEIGG